MDRNEVADRIEAFLRDHFAISPGDARFARDTDLFDRGYVDSVGVTELLGWLEQEFGVEVPEDDLLSDEFSTVDGIAAVVHRLA